ncbi:MAG TPA: radical SAM-associated putative lipoprotein [Candidatus Coprenecus stercoravium]|uniref:Radical SAM-associated putative lipoprotein n=1 Tax=Candidatus Coprenecus stercoravium TaxID=2840735 RepID=A0A9D2K9I3_9BACT|nr:radical SAM-associated putative lipoprotein [Candidatus Coprenecus stercoravium]
MNKFLKLLLVFLGIRAFASCDSLPPAKVEYGVPYASYEIKGRVTDADGNPIKGIKVDMLSEYDVDSAGNITLYPFYSEEDVLTDESGRFHVRNGDFPSDSLSVGFSDIDGAENGGEFATKVITKAVEQVEEGSGNWDKGVFVVPGEVEVVMDLKKEEE